MSSIVADMRKCRGTQLNRRMLAKKNSLQRQQTQFTQRVRRVSRLLVFLCLKKIREGSEVSALFVITWMRTTSLFSYGRRCCPRTKMDNFKGLKVFSASQQVSSLLIVC